MKIIIGMEASGVIRRAARAAGIDAISIDLRPAADASEHHRQQDIFDFLESDEGKDVDLAIYHPDCTYLTGAAAWAFADGPYHQKIKPGTIVGAARRAAREKAFGFVLRLEEASKRAGIRTRVYENPVGALSSMWRKPNFTIQPYEFGDDASKRTCFWVCGADLPPLVPTCRVPGRKVTLGGRVVERWSNQTDSGQNKLSPGSDRWSQRSETYPGVAQAIVDQWLKPFTLR